MKNIKFRALVLSVALFTASSALAADIVGSVRDPENKGVPGATIEAKDGSGKAIAHALSDSKGAYEMKDMAPGKYTFSVNPTASGFKPGEAVAELTPKGLTLDWLVSKTADSIALAKETPEVGFLAKDPFGMTMGGFLGTSAAGLSVAGIGTTIGLSSAGAFGSSSPASPGR